MTLAIRTLRPEPAAVTTTLPYLAETANREHALFGQSFGNALEHALAAGAALAAAKAQLIHGEWLPWLSENFTGSERAAQLYMKVAANPHAVADLPEPTLRKALEAINPSTRYDSHSGDFEWYTPAEYIAAAVRVMGAIDCDPASIATANEVVRAAQFYTAEDDGLSQPWRGRVWMNPPYSQPLVARFGARLCEELAYGNVTEAIVLLNNTTETASFQQMARLARAICFPAGRVKFYHPGGGLSAALQGQAFLYFGEHDRQFCAEFAGFGLCVAVLPGGAS
jgi:ParB family chromosome partitioning protein